MSKAIELAQAMRRNTFLILLRQGAELSEACARSLARDVDELLSAILDPPAEPQVDWTKPIQFADGLPCKLVHESQDGSSRPMLVVYRPEMSSEQSLWSRRDGKTGEFFHGDIINQPDPTTELRFEVAVAKKDSRSVVAVRSKEGGRVILLTPEPDWFAEQDSAEDYDWSFFDWQPHTITQ